MAWNYNLQSTVATQVAHVIAGIKLLDYDDLVKSILTPSEQLTTEWKENMDVRPYQVYIPIVLLPAIIVNYSLLETRVFQEMAFGKRQ